MSFRKPEPLAVWLGQQFDRGVRIFIDYRLLAANPSLDRRSAQIIDLGLSNKGENYGSAFRM